MRLNNELQAKQQFGLTIPAGLVFSNGTIVAANLGIILKDISSRNSLTDSGELEVKYNTTSYIQKPGSIVEGYSDKINLELINNQISSFKVIETQKTTDFKNQLPNSKDENPGFHGIVTVQNIPAGKGKVGFSLGMNSRKHDVTFENNSSSGDATKATRTEVINGNVVTTEFVRFNNVQFNSSEKITGELFSKDFSAELNYQQKRVRYYLKADWAKNTGVVTSDVNGLLNRTEQKRVVWTVGVKIPLTN